MVHNTPTSYHRSQAKVIKVMQKMLINLQQNERRHVQGKERRYRKWAVETTENITIHLCQSRHIRLTETMVRRMVLLRKFSRTYFHSAGFYAHYKKWMAEQRYYNIDEEQWVTLMQEDKDFYSQQLVADSDDE
ncbi:uncharacterized protein [Amphiura filiformis]|uniref:uncharacterized protein n=1 Tax=Amphiura filiformis TaxID=82378 RepID=UPI003B228F6D